MVYTVNLKPFDGLTDFLTDNIMMLILTIEKCDIAVTEDWVVGIDLMSKKQIQSTNEVARHVMDLTNPKKV